MPTVEQRLDTIERLLRDALRKIPPDSPKYLPEEEVTKTYKLGPERLKQLRLGYRKKGVWHEPVLLHWTKQNGRQVEYLAEELKQVLKRK